MGTTNGEVFLNTFGLKGCEVIMWNCGTMSISVSTYLCLYLWWSLTCNHKVALRAIGSRYSPRKKWGNDIISSTCTVGWGPICGQVSSFNAKTHCNWGNRLNCSIYLFGGFMMFHVFMLALNALKIISYFLNEVGKKGVSALMNSCRSSKVQRQGP